MMEKLSSVTPLSVADDRFTPALAPVIDPEFVRTQFCVLSASMPSPADVSTTVPAGALNVAEPGLNVCRTMVVVELGTVTCATAGATSVAAISRYSDRRRRPERDKAVAPGGLTIGGTQFTSRPLKGRL